MNDGLAPAFLDTSFIVRYLTNDPPDMATEAARVIDSDRPLLISEVILAESAYVLTSVYAVSRATVVDTLMQLIQRQNIALTCISKAIALDALRMCRHSNRYSFADVLLWAQAHHTNTKRVYSFDQRFPREGLTVYRSEDEAT